MIKKVNRMILVVLLFFAATMFLTFTSKVHAETNTSGDFEYQIVSGSITPSGVEITGYTGYDVNVEIPETISGYKVIGITNEVFKDNTSLAQVTIPTFVEWIGSSAFQGCYNLANVNNNSTMLNKINNNAFNNCTSLKAFTIPQISSSVAIRTTIGYKAFYNCTSLSTLEVNAVYLSDCNSSGNTFYDAGAAVEGGLSVTFSEEVTNVPADMFNCISDHYARVTNVVLGENIETIGSAAFQNCANLKIATNNSTKLQTIANYAFYNCQSLTSFVIPKISSSITVYTSIGYKAFYNCTSLSTLEVNAVYLSDCNSSGNTYYDAGAAVVGGLKVIFSEEVTNVPANMFNCISDHYARVTNVVLGKNIATIGSAAFEYCADLKIATNNSTELQTIANYAFYNCLSLTSFVIPSKTTSIGYKGFYNCQYMEKLTVKAKNLSDCNSSGDTFYNVGAAVVGGVKVTFTDSVTLIPAYMFFCSSDYYARVTSVVVGTNTANIGSAAFENCKSLETITNNSTKLTTINNYAFQNCSNLKYFRVSNISASIGYKAFDNCPKLCIFCYKNSTTHNYGVENSIKYKIILSKPSNVSATAISKTAIKISWNIVSNASGYYIYRSTSKNGTYKNIAKIGSGKSFSYKNTSLTGGKTYYYKVKAYYSNPNGDSTFSSLVSKRL